VSFTKVMEHSNDEVRVLVGEGTGVEGPGGAGIDDSEVGNSKIITGDKTA